MAPPPPLTLSSASYHSARQPQGRMVAIRAVLAGRGREGASRFRRKASGWVSFNPRSVIQLCFHTAIQRLLEFTKYYTSKTSSTFVFSRFTRQSRLLGACADATSLLVRRVDSMRVFTFAQRSPFPHIKTCNVIKS
jgi:hypothetical protein